ncbi:MAG: hypothetical protein JWQ79_2364 [Mucilaginibacter sp.]|jgi:hypothetical protein|nr:hypothetical protein [Mucilaginibacter sp.]
MLNNVKYTIWQKNLVFSLKIVLFEVTNVLPPKEIPYRIEAVLNNLFNLV